MDIDAIVKAAVQRRGNHFLFGQLMTRVSEGFKEANIAHDLSASFDRAGYYVYPEFPFEGGSIDAIFVRGTAVVICEWKRCYAGSASNIVSQTQRMMRFKATVELPAHGFANHQWREHFLWVCDAWNKQTIDWWEGKVSKIIPPCPFGNWHRGKHFFEGFKWPYIWIWAYQSMQ